AFSFFKKRGFRERESGESIIDIFLLVVGSLHGPRERVENKKLVNLLFLLSLYAFRNMNIVYIYLRG
ncbi:hypothetical protein KK475_28800, partial [Klebsiella pneumoniae]|uniref:hypothetical protein n=1 Tax=Klebsiella pneumoniae TaxID=573 RepID=UPI001BE11182